MTCPDADTLAALETLDDARRAEIVDHAANCRDCRPIVMAMIGMQEMLAFAEAATLASTDPPAGAAPEVTPTIDRYRVDRRIGEGAMGVVFAAYDPELARPVAVKVLRVGGSPDRMLAAAERAEKPSAFPIVARAFALAEALWETGGPRDRDRARALAEQATSRVGDARAFFEANPAAYASAIDRLDKLAIRVAAWRRTHR